MKIKSKDLLAWDIVSIALETIDPIEKKYLGDIICESNHGSSQKELPGAFDAGQVLQYTAQHLFPIVQYVLNIIVPMYLEGVVSLSIDEIKKRYKGSLNAQDDMGYQIKHSPDEVREIVLTHCLKNKISIDKSESIANAILVKLYFTKQK